MVKRHTGCITLIVSSILLLLPLLQFAIANEVSLKGSISNRYILRTTGTDTDNDIETLLSLDVGQPSTDKISGSMQAGGIFDLDKTRNGSPYRSIFDTFNSSAVGRFYYGYIDLKDPEDKNKIRLGRQYRHEFESLYYDGISFETDQSKPITFTAYSGIPVHLFENQYGLTVGDWLAGGALEWNIYTNLKFRFDYVHVKDEVTGFRSTLGINSDDLFGLSLWCDLTDRISISSDFTSFRDQVRDAQASATFRWSEQDLSLRYNFYTLFKAYSFRVLEFDGYGFAGAFEPYYEMTLSASKGLSEHFAVDGGFSIRNLVDKQIASAFNHGFERGYLSLSSYNIPIKDLSLNLTADYYHGKDNTLKNNSFGTSFSAVHGFFDKKLNITIGTAFYFYKFNLFLGNESNNVQSYFAEVETKILAKIKTSLRYEFENNQINDFHTLELGVRWDF